MINFTVCLVKSYDVVKCLGMTPFMLAIPMLIQVDVGIKAIRRGEWVIPQRSHGCHDKVKKLKFDALDVGDDCGGKYDYLDGLGVMVVYTRYGGMAYPPSLKRKIATHYNQLKNPESHLPNDVDIGQRLNFMA